MREGNDGWKNHGIMEQKIGRERDGIELYFSNKTCSQFGSNYKETS